MPRPTLAWLFVLLWTACTLNTSLAIWCDNEDCYEILGVSDKATPQEIRKAYIKLSLKYHPDKNPEKGAQQIFARIANAYEILYDEEKRKEYDYAIAHPEQFFYNTARYYQTYYNPKADLRLVLVVSLLFLSAFQYLNDWLRYHQAVEKVKQTPEYKNRVRRMEAERNAGKKKSRGKAKAELQEEPAQEVDLYIHGAEKPNIWTLIGVRFLALPFTLGKYLAWYFAWLSRYHFRSEPYTWTDADYLTRVALGLYSYQWKAIDIGQKDSLILKRLWIKSNMEEHQNEAKRESRGKGRR